MGFQFAILFLTLLAFGIVIIFLCLIEEYKSNKKENDLDFKFLDNINMLFHLRLLVFLIWLFIILVINM